MAINMMKAVDDFSSTSELEENMQILRELNQAYKNDLERKDRELIDLKALINDLKSASPFMHDTDYKNSIHNPMELKATQMGIKSMVIHETETLAFDHAFDPVRFEKQYHLMMKCGDKVLRFSNAPALDHEKMTPELAAMIYDQMSEALKAEFVQAVMVNRSGF